MLVEDLPGVFGGLFGRIKGSKVFASHIQAGIRVASVGGALLVLCQKSVFHIKLTLQNHSKELIHS